MCKLKILGITIRKLETNVNGLCAIIVITATYAGWAVAIPGKKGGVADGYCI
jgi:hypothetical protein